MSTDQCTNWNFPGARWWKFDFHTHTPKSVDYGKGKKQASLKQIDAKDWLLGFMRAKIDCVAITDHNTGAWVDHLKEELTELEQIQHPDFRPLRLFPGVELSVNPGFHLLAIFGPDSTTHNIESLIDEIRYDGDRGDGNGVTEFSAVQVIRAVLSRGGIPIPAHVERPNGLLCPKESYPRKTALNASTVSQVLDCEGMLAVEVIDTECEKPGLYKHHRLAWSEVLGSDSHHPEGESEEKYPGSHYTWVKMAMPSLEGLRLALQDGGGFSIRRSDASEPFDAFALPNHCIESIEIGAARYMGNGEPPARLDFNPGLNALIGGRGTGKSTVLHALRLVARRDSDFEALPAHSESRETFKRFNQVPSDQTKGGGLTVNTRIQWTLMRDGVRHRVHWTKSGTDIVVEDESQPEKWVSSSVQAVIPERFPIQMFSQGQIVDLAGDDPTALLKEIDRVAGVGKLQGKLDGAVAAFDSSQARIRELESRLERLEHSTVVGLEDVTRKLDRFEAARHRSVLTAYRHRRQQRQELDGQFDAVEEAAKHIEATAEGLQLVGLPEDTFDQAAEEDRQAAEVVNQLRAALETARQRSSEVAQNLREVVASQREGLKESKWEASAKEAEKAYQELGKILGTEDVADPKGYDSLVQEKQRIDKAMKELRSDREERVKYAGESQERLQEVQEARRAMTRARREFLSTALSQNNFVRIEIRPYGDDPHIIERSLRKALNVTDDRFSDDILKTDAGSKLTGVVAELIRALPEEPDRRMSELDSRLGKLKERFKSACAGQSEFGGHFNNYLQRQFEERPELLDNLLTWFPEDGLSVEYSRTGDGRDFQPISQASAGQRSAAMLAFLLAHGEEPLVLDQPEDDLDNHLIYDLVVRQIRENKLRRQIIVVTHNPNIVVNGDAEMLHALAFHEGQCVVMQSGSLQEEAMRDEVCRVMEGGREAFRRRYKRLG